MAHIDLTIKRDGYVQVANALAAIDLGRQEEETSFSEYVGSSSVGDVFGKVLRVAVPSLIGAGLGGGIGALVGSTGGPVGTALGAKIGGVIGGGLACVYSISREVTETSKSYKVWKEKKDKNLLHPFSTIFQDTESLRELQCPISHDIMLFPTRVNCAAHHTFDYFPILDWVETCAQHEREPTCPLCRDVIDVDLFTCNYRVSGRIGSIYRNVLQVTNATVVLSNEQRESLTYCSRTIQDSITKAFDIEKGVLDKKYREKTITSSQFCTSIGDLGETLYPTVTLIREAEQA